MLVCLLAAALAGTLLGIWRALHPSGVMTFIALPIVFIGGFQYLHQSWQVGFVMLALFFGLGWSTQALLRHWCQRVQRKEIAKAA